MQMRTVLLKLLPFGDSIFPTNKATLRQVLGMRISRGCSCRESGCILKCTHSCFSRRALDRAFPWVHLLIDYAMASWRYILSKRGFALWSAPCNLGLEQAWGCTVLEGASQVARSVCVVAANKCLNSFDCKRKTRCGISVRCLARAPLATSWGQFFVLLVATSFDAVRLLGVSNQSSAWFVRYHFGQSLFLAESFLNWVRYCA